ncbi:glycosyltransferase family 4 protein [Nitrosomonas ureae]|uniref:Glycosyltransferase involved in cell wall bisynthesis n=1 Tax=Nitrosomonas ureae TaxID=44577 RepID=A0A1H9AP15_9PROT|nr:glycosyltransferase family 4 protein [Nitrosomonas ureae]SEP78516.1 Glycosyltransferase involved in cell wall bisynthesis [Nitrosomonas ureae]
MRIVILSHAHPTFSKGGGEIAAYNLFKGINETNIHEAWFVARADAKLMHLGTPVAALNEREYLIAGNAGISHLTATIDLGDDSDFAGMLRNIQPDVVHFHHYIFLGVEMIRAAKRVCPNAKIVLTLHEYIAICMNSGQMIKKDGRLCYRSSPRECAQCFPDWTAEDFFLRERYIKTYFNLVDQFISPSEFLRQRYIAWGIPAEKIMVIENGLPPGEKLPPRSLRADESRGRFAYFGQINSFKGVDLILEAFAQLPKKVRRLASLDIYGSGLEWQNEDYKNKINKLFEKNKDIIRYHGSYESEELSKLMESIDWVVMGSIWWENSPVVIQEAFKFGRPVICPDIGGMAEKVTNGKGGLNFRARDSLSLKSLITSLLSENDIYQEVTAEIPPYLDFFSCAKKHVEVYER